MNLDDPRLTAFALGELGEPERSIIARAVADSPEAQQFVDETRELSRALKSEYTVELDKETPAPANLIDIHDDPWFWSVARPLAVAATISIFAILSAIGIGVYKSRNDSAAAAPAGVEYAEVEAEEKPQTGAPSDFSGPNNIPNPLPVDAIQRVDRVVIGELDVDPSLEDGEIRVIETIADAFRVQRLKERLTTRVLSKKPRRGFIGRAYELMFLDRNGHVVASAGFYHAPGLGFVLHPSKQAYERDGHYFAGRGDVVLPGDWDPNIDYFGYVILFPDWSECIGYRPDV